MTIYTLENETGNITVFPTGFGPTRPWKLPYITIWEDSQSQNPPTNSAEEAKKQTCFDLSLKDMKDGV